MKLRKHDSKRVTGARGITVLSTLLAATSIAVPAGVAAQQPDTIRLRELVVTATRVPTARADAPGSIDVVTGEQMRERGQRFLVDALRSVPGVTIAQSSGHGSVTSLFVRGAESDHVQVLIDGVQVNDPGGAYEWAHLRAEDIERIEVVRGPASVLYGSDAVAGVIQVFTRSGGTPRVEVGVTGARGDRTGDPERSTHRTEAFDASLTGAAGVRNITLEYGASGGYTRSNGLFAFNSDYDNAAASGRVLLRHARADLGITARYAEREYQYPTSGSGAVVDPNQFSTGDTRTFGLDGGVRLTSFAELRVLGTLHDAASRTHDPADNEADGTSWSTADQLRRTVDARVNVTLPHASLLTVGVEREWQEVQTAYESISEWGTFGEESDESRRNTGGYAQLHAAPHRVLAITVGGRLDDNERFGSFRTARAAVNVKPGAATRIHAAAGTAFKEPTFYENYATGFTRGNPQLQPEQSRSWEAGVEHGLARAVTLSATYFDQRFRNLIQYTAAPEPEEPNYENVGRARARGVELGASAARGPVAANLSWTWTSAEVVDAGFGEDPAFAQGQRLLRRPEYQAALDATVRLGNAARVLLGARYVGERDDLDFTDPVQWSGIRTTLDSHTLIDATLVWTVPFGRGALDASFGARNLLDERYAEIYNFPAPGRVLHMGLRARLGL